MNTTSLASALDSLFGTISTCDSIFAKNGSTKGLISTANLASVLGAGRIPEGEILNSGGNILSLSHGCYQSTSGTTTASLVNKPSTLPSTHACRIIVMKLYGSDNYKHILIFCGNKIFFCYAYYSSGSWRNDGWQELSSSTV